MKGLCEKAYLILQREDYIGEPGDIGYSRLLSAVKNLTSYFREMDIQLQCFTTDSGAAKLLPGDVEWVSPIPQEDVIFINRNWEGIYNGEDIIWLDYDNLRKQVPLPKRGSSEDARLDVIAKREKLQVQKLLKEAKCIIMIATPATSSFTVKGEKGDGRFIMKVDPKSFVATLTVGDEECDLVHVFPDSRAVRPVDVWHLM